MASPRVGNIERQDSESEHIGPDYSGDNISAKKVAGYGWDTVNSQWRRVAVDSGGTLLVDGSAVTQPTSLINGFISTGNSSTTPLGIAGTYTGTAEDITKYAAVGIFVGTDRSGTLYYDSSTDGTNWDKTETYPVTVTTGGVVQGFFFQAQAHTKYYRVRYLNDGTAQGIFRLQTTLRDVPGTAEVLAVNIPMTGITDALTTKSVIYGVTTAGGGGYVGVKVNPSGALTTDTTVSGSVSTLETSGLVPKIFDTIQVTSYNANNDPLVAVYRTGGAAGTVVATLTITYDGTFRITQVVRT